MKLILNLDPLFELEEMLKDALSMEQGRVKHIEVSRQEMKAIVTHMDAKRVIPDYMLPQEARLIKCRGRMQALRNNQELPEYKIPQQEFFDKMDVLEKEEMDIEFVVPKQFTQSGIVIFSTIV